MLDTNVCIDYLGGRYPQVVERLQQLRPPDVAVSSVAVAELRYGAERSQRKRENHDRLDRLFEDLPVLDFDLQAGAAYGRVRADLEARGTPIGSNDMLIAAQAIAHDLILVGDNVAEFGRVNGLRLENWRD